VDADWEAMPDLLEERFRIHPLSELSNVQVPHGPRWGVRRTWKITDLRPSALRSARIP